MFNSHPEEAASGFPIDPPRPSQALEESRNDHQENIHKKASHPGPLTNRDAWVKAGKNMGEAPKFLPWADLSSMSGLVAARRSMFSEELREKSHSQQETPPLIARIPGSFKEASNSTVKQDQKNQVIAGSHQHVEESTSNDPVPLSYGLKGNKIHYSGPLIVPSGKADQILKDYDCQMQEPVRRLDNARMRKLQVEGNQQSTSSLLVSGR